MTKPSDMVDDWLRYQDHFLVKCRYCKLIVEYHSMSMTIMRWHLRKDHPEKIGWKGKK